MSDYKNDRQIIGFIRENQEKLYRVAYSYVKNEETALDIVQDTIVKVLQNRHTLRNKEFIKTWVYKILINECLMYLRKNKNMIYFDNLENYTQQLTSEAPDSDKIDLYNAVDKLPPKLKAVIILRFFEQLKLDEIASVTSTNQNTVKTRLYKALKMLKVDLDIPEDDINL